MTLTEAIILIESEKRSVTVQKLYRNTGIADCSKQLWDFLGMDSNYVHGRRPDGSYFPRPLIADLPHEVWLCEVGQRSLRKASAYGRTFEEAVERAFK